MVNKQMKQTLIWSTEPNWPVLVERKKVITLNLVELPLVQENKENPIPLKVEQFMKVNGLVRLEMDGESRLGLMGLNMKVN